MFVFNWTFQLYILFFIGIKIVEKNQERNSLFWKILLYTYGPIFIVLDVGYDIIVGTIIFRRTPEWRLRKKTFTARLKLYKKQDNPGTYEYELAVKFCRMLNHVDENHC